MLAAGGSLSIKEERTGKKRSGMKVYKAPTATYKKKII